MQLKGKRIQSDVDQEGLDVRGNLSPSEASAGEDRAD
jgi:hypothetical protein